jgi:4-amino-4-deoxy-L-arabinose transferase-like glycosyltransferase
MSRPALLAAVVVLLGLGLRVAHATGRESLWRDEAVDWFIVTENGSLGELLAHFEVEGAPPLHYVLEFLLVHVAGPGLAALRGMAVVFGTLTVFLVLLLGWRAFGWPAGVLSGLVAATNPYLIYYSTEVRNYALFGATAALHVLVYLRLLQRPSWKGALSWGAAAALMAYVHYYAFHMILCAGLYFLWRHRSRRGLGLASAAGGAFLLIYLPWIPTLVTQIRNDLHPWFVPVTDVTAALDVFRLPFGSECAYALPLSLALGAWVASKRADDRTIAFRALCWIGVGGALCGWIGQRFAGPYVSRHLLGMAVVLIPSACVCWAAWARLSFRRAWLGRVAWIVIVMLVVLNWRSRGEWLRQPSSARAIAELIRTEAGENDLVWCSSATYGSFAYYFDGPQRQITVPYKGRKTLLDWKELPERMEDETVAAELVAEIEAQLDSGGSVWVVGPAERAMDEDPRQRLQRAQARIHKRALEVIHKKGVAAQVWERDGYDEDLALILFRPR